MADVGRFDDRIRLGVEDPLEVVKHGARAASTPCGVLAERVQLLRRIAHAADGVGDLRVRRHHQPVGTAQRQNDRHNSAPVRIGRSSHAASSRTPAMSSAMTLTISSPT